MPNGDKWAETTASEIACRTLHRLTQLDDQLDERPRVIATLELLANELCATIGRPKRKSLWARHLKDESVGTLTDLADQISAECRSHARRNVPDVLTGNAVTDLEEFYYQQLIEALDLELLAAQAGYVELEKQHTGKRAITALAAAAGVVGGAIVLFSILKRPKPPRGLDDTETG